MVALINAPLTLNEVLGKFNGYRVPGTASTAPGYRWER